MIQKVKLAGGPDKSATWIWLEEGRLRVEYYDFSEPAHTFFGNDIAWIMTVPDMGRLYATVNQSKETLIPWMEQYFRSYFGIKQWLEENGIDFNIERESWA